MEMPKRITIRQYLTEKRIAFSERNGQLITHCLFSGCDDDSTGNEAHLSFNAKTGQYHCYKCGATGNIITLARHLDGDPRAVIVREPKPRLGRTREKIDEKLVEEYHKAMPVRIRKYLNGRGISDGVIDNHKLGYGSFYKRSWITIPIKDHDGNFKFLKLRQDPDEGEDKHTYPGGEAEIYDWDMAKGAQDKLVICEGELDRLALLSKGVPAVTSTAGAGTFKKQWIQHFSKDVSLYICYDTDDAGQAGAEDVATKFNEAGYKNTYLITLPSEVGEKGDVTDYFVKLNGTVEDLFGKHASLYPEEIDPAQFKPLFADGLAEVLGLTIKHDDINKVVTFLGQLSAYTEENQINISFNAPSSTGKSYIPTEIAKLFPKAEVKEYGYCSPTAFYHEAGKYDAATNSYTVDLEHKILIFIDQPHPQLLERLRPVLSHDKKEITVKITDKSQKHGMKTKTVILIGYPAVTFCTAGLKLNEQEATRFILLSPEMSQQKIKNAICQTIRRESDSGQFRAGVDADPERKLLMRRILAIKAARIIDIRMESPEKVQKEFLKRYPKLKSRQQRDIKNLISIIKAIALLNLWWRNREGGTITANREDVQEGFKIWDSIYASQEFSLPPYVFNLYRDVILSCWFERNKDLKPGENPQGISRQEILDFHYKTRGSMLDGTRLRSEIIPILETAGLILQETDPFDKRIKRVIPLILDLKVQADIVQPGVG